jgi:hypothetical protein
MLDLAGHIIDTMVGHFKPEKFEDRYEDALRVLIKRKQAGEKITPAEIEKPKKAMNLMDALRASLQGAARPSAAAARKRVSEKTRRAPAHGARSGRDLLVGIIGSAKLEDRRRGDDAEPQADQHRNWSSGPRCANPAVR